MQQTLKKMKLHATLLSRKMERNTCETYGVMVNYGNVSLYIFDWLVDVKAPLPMEERCGQIRGAIKMKGARWKARRRWNVSLEKCSETRVRRMKWW